MDAKELDYLKEYVVKHVRHMNIYMRPLFSPEGKQILVIGSGWGVETYWCLVNGASYVVGADPADRSTGPLEAALREHDPDTLSRFEHHRCVIQQLPDNDSFDAIISNNVFEHIFDLAETLGACRRFMTKKGNRLHIFTDPLYNSSAGAHLPIDPWAHLIVEEDRLRESLSKKANWNQFKYGLNKMTFSTFIESISDSGMWIEKLSIVADRNRTLYHNYIDGLKHIKPMDALLEGIACTLAFPENI